MPNKFNYYSKFFNKLKNKSGRNYKNFIIIKSKSISKLIKNYQCFDDNRIWSTNLSIILKLKINYINTLLGLIKYSNGSLSVIKVPYGLSIGSFIKSTILPLHLYKISLLGFRVFLYYLKINMIFFDLGLYGNKNIYVKASGTFSQIIQINKDLNLILILLPSGKKKYVSLNYLCTLGRNNNIFKKFIVLGKAGINKYIGKNVTVRGVAMNPVDHPHGGRTKTNKPEVSPWGWVAKYSH